MAGGSQLPDRTGTLVVGAGLVGCSVAHALTDLGRSAVTVIDQGPLPNAGGTSSFAPSGLFQVAPARTRSLLIQQTRDLAQGFDAYLEGGSLEVAMTPDYEPTLARRMDQAVAWGVDAERLDPDAVGDRLVSLDSDQIDGGVHVPSDGSLASVDLLEALQDVAAARGASFHSGIEVTGIETDGRAVGGVVTDRGRIQADEIVLATNVWTPRLARSIDLDLPMAVVVHQYAVTRPLEELSAPGGVNGPWIRVPEAGVYARQHGTALGIGHYGNEPTVIDPADIGRPNGSGPDDGYTDHELGGTDTRDPSVSPAARPLTESEFEPALSALTTIFPALEGAVLDDGVDALMAVTPDNNPILGEVPGVDGCWLAVAVPSMLAGGVGRVLAGLMERDTTDVDIDPWHVARFQPHSGSPTFVEARGLASYRHANGAPNPGGIETTGKTLRESPFYRYQESLGADFYDLRYGGWKRPMRFESNEALLESYEIPERSGRDPDWSPVEAVEHLAVRDRVGMSDLTSFSTFDIVGPAAIEFGQSVFSNDIDRPEGQVTYTLLLDEGGGIHGDMTVIRRNSDRLHVISNSGGAGTKQIARLRRLAPDDGSVHVVDRIGSRCGISVSGPNARAMLEPVVDANLDSASFPYFTAQETYVEDIPVLAARVSYVGELGWEFHTSMEYGAELWRVLWEAGQDHGVLPFGDGALVTLRLEKGFPAYGVDIHPAVTPFEADLEHTVALDSDFIGREALLEQRDRGLNRKRATLVLDDSNAVVQSGSPVLDGDERVGYLSSAGEGYFVDSYIVYAYLPPAYTDVGTELEIQSGDERYEATVSESILFDPDRERLLA